MTKRLFSLFLTALVLQAHLVSAQVYINKLSIAGEDFVVADVLKTSDGIFYIGHSLASGGDEQFVVYRTDENGTIEASNEFGGGGNQKGQAICDDGNGNYYIVGVDDNNSQGGYDLIVNKINADCQTQWTNWKLFGGAYDEEATDIVYLDNDDIAIVGSTKSIVTAIPVNGVAKSALTMCISNTGTLQWLKSFGGDLLDPAGPTYSNDRARGVVQLSNSEIAVTGVTDAIGNGGQDVLLMTFKTDGTVTNIEAYGTSRDDVGIDVDFTFNTSTVSYIDIAGKTKDNLDPGNPSEDAPIWLRVTADVSGTSSTLSSPAMKQMEDALGSYDLDKVTSIISDGSDLHFGGTIGGTGSFIYKEATTPKAKAYSYKNAEADVVGILRSATAADYLITSEDNVKKAIYLTKTNDDLELDNCPSLVLDIDLTSMTISTEDYSNSGSLVQSSSITTANRSKGTSTPPIVLNSICDGDAFQNVYTNCLDVPWTSGDGLDQLIPVDILENGAGHVMVLARRSLSVGASDFDKPAVLMELDDENGDVLSELSLTLKDISGGGEQSFNPKSFVEVATDKYMILGEHIFEYNDNGTVKQTQDLMMVYVEPNSVTWAKSLEVTSGTIEEYALKIIKLYDALGAPNGYGIAANADLVTYGDNGIVINTQLDGTINWSKKIGSTVTGSGLLTTVVNDILQTGNGGDIVVGGKSDWITQGTGPDGFIYSFSLNGSTTNITRVYKENLANVSTMEVKKLQYDGSYLYMLFSKANTVKGIVKLDESDGTAEEYLSNPIGFKYTRDIENFFVDGTTFYITGNNNNNIFAGSINHANSNTSANWEVETGYVGTETFSASYLGTANLHITGSTGSTNLDCEQSAGTINHQLVSSAGRAYGISSGCEKLLSNAFTTFNIVTDDPDRVGYGSVEMDLTDFVKSNFEKSTDKTQEQPMCGASFLTSGPNSENDDEETYEEEITSIDMGFEEGTISIYPNPVSNQLTIEGDLAMTTVSIMDMNGRVLSTFNNVGKQTTISTTDLQSGIYLVQIVTNQSTEIRPITKK